MCAAVILFHINDDLVAGDPQSGNSFGTFACDSMDAAAQVARSINLACEREVCLIVSCAQRDSLPRRSNGENSMALSSSRVIHPYVSL